MIRADFFCSSVGCLGSAQMPDEQERGMEDDPTWERGRRGGKGARPSTTK